MQDGTADGEFRYYMAREWLEDVARMGARCEMAREMVESERAAAAGVSAIDYSRDKVDVSPDGDAMPDAVERIRARIVQYVQAEVEYEGARSEAFDALALMDDSTEALALVKHYLAGKPWTKVADEMGYTVDGVYTLRRRAVADAYYVMPEGRRAELPDAVGR